MAEQFPRRIAVLGGAGGIGRALVASLLDGGDDVTVLDLPASLEKHPSKANSIPVDVLSNDAVTTAFGQLARRWKAVDGFVNLAGYNSHLKPLAEMSEAYFDDVIAGNLRGTFISTRAVLPLMAERSSIVLMASGLAQFVRPGYGAYSASKAGVVALAKTLAQECAPLTRVNAVAPGLVDTAFLRDGTGRSDESANSIVDFESYVSAIPLKRLAMPEDVTGPIAFLLGSQSRYMTGQVLWINGGAYMP